MIASHFEGKRVKKSPRGAKLEGFTVYIQYIRVVSWLVSFQSPSRDSTPVAVAKK